MMNFIKNIKKNHLIILILIISIIILFIFFINLDNSIENIKLDKDNSIKDVKLDTDIEKQITNNSKEIVQQITNTNKNKEIIQQITNNSNDNIKNNTIKSTETNVDRYYYDNNYKQHYYKDSKVKSMNPVDYTFDFAKPSNNNKMICPEHPGNFTHESCARCIYIINIEMPKYIDRNNFIPCCSDSYVWDTRVKAMRLYDTGADCTDFYMIAHCLWYPDSPHELCKFVVLKK